MDPSAVIRTFKDAYLVSRFVYRSVKAKQNKDKDWEVLQSKFRHEHGLLGHYGLYLQNKGALDESTLRDPSCASWVRDFQAICFRLQQLYIEYERIARRQDPAYQKHGSETAPVTEHLQIGFVWELDDQANDVEPIPASEPRRTVGQQIQDWRFVFFEKKALDKLLVEVRDETARLVQLGPVIERTHPRYKQVRWTPEQLDASIARAVTRAIGQHRQIRQLTIENSTLERITQVPDESDTDSEESESLSSLRTSSANDLFLDPPPDLEPTDGAGLHEATISMSGQASRKVLVEYKTYRQQILTPDIDASSSANSQPELVSIEGAKEIERLVLLLASGGPNLSILPLHGCINQTKHSRYAFVYDYPRNCQHGPPTSLYDLVSDTSRYVPIDLLDRFDLATTIATTLAAIHTDGWVHKSIRSSSIVFFHKVNSQKPDSSKPYLSGFEYSRPVEGPTAHDTDNILSSNIYRHPERQGTPDADFNVTHDIYALGVVLLEIGLWKTAFQIYKDFNQGIEPTMANISQARETFEKAAGQPLVHTMSHKYANAVKRCLSEDFDSEKSLMSFGDVLRNLDPFAKRSRRDQA